MGAEQTKETAPTAPYTGRRFSRLGLRRTLVGIISNTPPTSSADLGLNRGPELGRRNFLSIFAFVSTDPGLAFTILERLAEGLNNDVSQERGALQREEKTLLANIRGYVHPSRIGKLGEDFETDQQLINSLKGRRRVLRDEFGVNYSWDGLEEFLTGFKRFDAGFRVSGAGLDYLDVVSIADLEQSQFSQELVPVYGSRFSDKGLPGYRLGEALYEYYQVPKPDRVEETIRYGDGMNGILVSGRSFNNNLYSFDFYADGLLKLFIQNPRIQQTGPLA